MDLRNLSKLTYGNGFTLWHYWARYHTVDEVMKDGFFDDASYQLSSGDKIEVSANDGGISLFVSVSSTFTNKVIVQRWN